MDATGGGSHLHIVEGASFERKGPGSSSGYHRVQNCSADGAMGSGENRSTQTEAASSGLEPAHLSLRNDGLGGSGRCALFVAGIDCSGYVVIRLIRSYGAVGIGGVAVERRIDL